MLAIGEISPAALTSNDAGVTAPVARLAAIIAPEPIKYERLFLVPVGDCPLPGTAERMISSFGSCSRILGE